MTSYWDVYSETLPHCYPESKADDRWLRRLATGDVFPDALRQLRWTIDSATVADVPLAIVSSRIVSDRVKVLLESNLGPKDNVRWAPSTVVTKDGVEHPYWTPLFFPALDPTTILHPAHTTWGPGGPSDGSLRSQQWKATMSRWSSRSAENSLSPKAFVVS